MLEDLDVDLDGAALLDELRDLLTTYVVLPTAEATDAVVLWIAATHALPAFQHAPRLAINSPEKRCGKSRLLEIIAGTCHRPLKSMNATVAAIFRSIGGDHPPTLLFDEADAMFGTKIKAEQNEDLRALLNAGHARGQTTLRCVGPLQTPTEFPTFAMATIAGIGALPDTICDRAVNVTMRRRRGDESVLAFRTRRDGGRLEEFRGRLAVWASGQVAALADAEPDLPVEDRAADTWEPLVAVADAAGGTWPARARAAALHLTDQADAEDVERSTTTRLLADIRDIFTEMTVSFLTSSELLSRLQKVEESPWSEWEMTTRKLALRLRQFGIRPGHNAARTARGYRLEDLADAFSRYLPAPPSGSVQPVQYAADLREHLDGSSDLDGSTRPKKPTRPDETAGQAPYGRVRTGADGGTAGSGATNGPCTRCGRLCRRYGDGGSPLCETCRKAGVA